MTRLSDPSDRPIRCGSTVWYSEAARSLVEVWRVANPLEAVRLSASELLREAEMFAPPVDLALVGSFCDVRSVEISAIAQSAQLIPQPNGYRIVLKSAESARRRRFSHAHEIFHLRIPAYAASPKRRDDATTGDYGRDKEEEYLCDFGASELLMPLELFNRAVSVGGLSLASARSAAERFQVSLEAAGRRLTQCGQGECALIVWEEDLKPSQLREASAECLFPDRPDLRPQPKLRIRSASTSPGMSQFYFPRAKSAEPDSLPYACLSAESVIEGECPLPTSKGMVVFHTESVFAPYLRGGVVRNRVITLVRPNHSRHRAALRTGLRCFPCQS